MILNFIAFTGSLLKTSPVLLITSTEHAIADGCGVAAGLDALRIRLDLAGLLEGYTQRLGSHAGGSGLQVSVLLAQLLDFILARDGTAEWALEEKKL